MTLLSLARTTSATALAALILSGCTRLTEPELVQPSTNATSVDYGNFGPRQPSSGFTSTGSVISDEATTGVFGTTDQISVDDSGPFPNNALSLDPSLSDLSAEDQALLAGTGIDFAAESALSSSISFTGDDGTPNFFDADIGTTIYFATNSSDLSEDARAILRKQAAWLNVHEGVTATIEGHTDERGTREFNIALGERRASTVRGYLTALGVANERLRKVSYGKERPAVSGSGEAAWNANRRTVTVLDPSGARPASAETNAPASSGISNSSVDDLLNDPVLNTLPAGDPLLDDPLLNDPFLNDPLLNDV